jgi:hypothetical protein
VALGNDLNGPKPGGEFVEIRNQGDTAQEMLGWTLYDRANHTFVFPNCRLEANGVLRIWTGAGENTDSELYWGRKAAVWNRSGDTAYLRDAAGNLVSTFTSTPDKISP